MRLLIGDILFYSFPFQIKYFIASLFTLITFLYADRYYDSRLGAYNSTSQHTYIHTHTQTPTQSHKHHIPNEYKYILYIHRYKWEAMMVVGLPTPSSHSMCITLLYIYDMTFYIIIICNNDDDE